MSSLTAADLKLGGRLVTACDAVGAGHLRRAAGIFAEIADDLNREAEETTGLLAPDEDDWSVPLPQKPKPVQAYDLQSCARGAHMYGAVDSRGWRECMACGVTSVVG